jgi:hypothetical protein
MNLMKKRSTYIIYSYLVDVSKFQFKPSFSIIFGGCVKRTIYLVRCAVLLFGVLCCSFIRNFKFR